MYHFQTSPHLRQTTNKQQKKPKTQYLYILKFFLPYQDFIDKKKRIKK